MYVCMYIIHTHWVALNTPDTNVVNQPRSCTPSQPLNRTSALRGWSINKPMGLSSLKLPATSLAWRHWDMVGVRGAIFFVRRTDVENCVVYRCKQLNI